MISPSSPLAVLFASLVVSASGVNAPMERPHPQKVTSIATKLKPSVRQSWNSAISNDDSAELLKLFMQNDPTSLLGYSASNGKSALMVAAKTGHQRLATLLVEAGADIDETTDTQGTAFMFSILGGHIELAQWFVEQGADIDKIGSNGWTAVTIAASKGNVSLLQWLISLGADTQVRDVYRFTPLMRAVNNGYVEAAAVLLSLVQTDVNSQDELGNTALHHAVSANHSAMVNLLLEHRARPDILNSNGLSAIDLATRQNEQSNKTFEALNRASKALNLEH